VQEKFGGLVMIYGTLMTSFIALLIAVPVSFGIALFLTELSPGWLKRPLGTAIELLAAVPSIVYGMWGLLVFGPILATYVQQPLQAASGTCRCWAPWFSGPPVGIGILSAGIILAIMIIPFIASVMRDVFEVTPAMLKESAYGLGATTWEVVSRWCCPTPRPAWSAASCWAWAARWARRWRSPSSSATSTSSTRCRCSRPPTASPRRWPTSSPRPAKGLHQASLIYLGLVLFFITFVVLALSKLLLAHCARGEGTRT
jgi:phosphate transport system permease protein